MCKMILGYAVDSSHSKCAMIGGCGCSYNGVDHCADIYKTQEECEKACLNNQGTGSSKCTIGGSSCGKGEYCKSTSGGQCSGSGICTKMGTMCPAIYQPVCGCDGKDYGSECSAGSQGMNVKSKGTCSSGGSNTSGSTCQIGSTSCGSGMYCKASAVGVCSGKGLCEAVPTVCNKILISVCGCDGKDYGNPCMAASQSMNLASKGKCGSGGTGVISKVCPKGCTSWFDGCNTCSCQGVGQVGACTKKYCSVKQAPKCLNP
jgi:hypothetical protein